jgi:hypothetical protein
MAALAHVGKGEVFYWATLGSTTSISTTENRAIATNLFRIY